MRHIFVAISGYYLTNYKSCVCAPMYVCLLHIEPSKFVLSPEYVTPTFPKPVVKFAVFNCLGVCVLTAEPTEFAVIPEDVTPTFPDPVTFTVQARSDPDTPVIYTWYRYDEDKDSSCPDQWCPVLHVANKTHIAMGVNGSSLTILNTNRDDLGVYRAVATNGVDETHYEVKLLTPPDLGNSIDICDRRIFKTCFDIAGCSMTGSASSLKTGFTCLKVTIQYD